MKTQSPKWKISHHSTPNLNHLFLHQKNLLLPQHHLLQLYKKKKKRKLMLSQAVLTVNSNLSSLRSHQLYQQHQAKKPTNKWFSAFTIKKEQNKTLSTGQRQSSLNPPLTMDT